MEIFRDIKNYEGIYKVSNKGNIYSNKNNKLLKLSIHHSGYKIVGLNKNGKGKSFNVHRLVAEAFLPNPDNLPYINHKDENKTNNFVWINEDGSVDIEKSNLEWCTPEYNTNYGNRNKKVSEKMINGKKSKPVYQYDLEENFIKEWPSSMEIQRQLNYKQSGICNCCNGVYKQMYGFVWKFKNNVINVK